LYLVIGRGWRLGDLGWVTQRAFRQGMTGISTGIDSLSTRLADVKTRLAARIAEVSRKQDEAATAAAAMRAHLADVGADVETVRNQVGQLHSTILNMDVEILDIGVNQRHALHGIYILCKAVGELSAGSTIASKTELLEYTKSPIWQRVRPQQQGLEGILQENPTTLRDPANYSQIGGGGNGSGGFASSNGVFQGDEPWLRQRYMLGTVDGARGSAGGSSGGGNSHRTEEESSSAFMKALPPRDLSHHTHRETTTTTSGFGGNVGGTIGGHSDIRRSGAGGFDRFGAATTTTTAERNSLNQRQGGGFGRDW
jgi:hypothetical protein